MKIIIVGNGGHSRVIQEMVSSSKTQTIMAILDDKFELEYKEKGIFYGPVSSLDKLMKPNVRVIVAIGDNKIRKRVAEDLDLTIDQYTSVIHPTAIVSRSAVIENGTVVMPQAVINAKAKIGMHCIINTGSIIEHDNSLGDYTHISPRATLTGDITTEEGVHVGASATIIPGIELGKWSVIGAGSTVIDAVPAYSKAVGSPSRIVKRILVT